MLTVSRDLSTQIRTRNFPVGAVFADNIVHLLSVWSNKKTNYYYTADGTVPGFSEISWNLLSTELRRECELNGLWRVETEKNPVIYI